MDERQKDSSRFFLKCVSFSYFGKDYAPVSKIGCGGGNIESGTKSREACPHRLNTTGYHHTIRNKKGRIMKPINLKAGS